MSSVPNVLLLPPIGLDAGCWSWMRLPFRATAVEYGDLSSLDAAADDLLRRHGAGPFDLVGVSLGGMVALHLALRHPASVRSLVLAATTAQGVREIMLERAATAEREGMPPVLGETLARWFTPAFLTNPTHADIVDYVTVTLENEDAARFAAGWRAIADHDVTAELSRIGVPVTCIAGASDVSTPPSVMASLAAGIPGARSEQIAAAHLLPLENPDDFTEAITRHLEWVLRRG